MVFLGFRNTINRRHVAPFLAGGFVGFLVSGVILWLSSGHVRFDLRDPHDNSDLIYTSGPEEDVGFHSMGGAHAHENNSLALQMYKDVRVLCWIMTSPRNHHRKALHVKRTWSSRCNKLLFMSSEKDPELDTIALPVNEGRNNLWAKTKEAFKYIYKHHMDDADWFLKADDDTYVIVENLRYTLQPYSPTFPIYLGCKFKTFVKQGYMAGGAGYVLSKEAVKRLVEDGLPDKNKCNQGPDGYEDVEMGRCMENLNVIAGDSRDEFGRHRFLNFVPEHHLIPGHTERDYWFWKYIFYDTVEGLECCSDNPVSFHYMSPNQMYVFDYLVYHVRPYGMIFNSQPLLDKINFSDLNYPENVLTNEINNTAKPLNSGISS